MISKYILAVLVACIALMHHNTAQAFDRNYVGEMQTIIAQGDSTLAEIARDNNLGFVELRAANPHLDPWMPGDGAEITLPKRHILPDGPRSGLVINLPEMRLYAYMKEGEPPVSYPLGIGREGLETPLGKTEVVRKQEGPSWRPTPRMRREDPELPAEVPPGPNNPLGSHALYLGWPSYAIHGTNKPDGIGRRISSGCIRLYPEDIKTLFGMVPVGTDVSVVNQPLKLAWIDNVLYLEAHPDLEHAIQMEETGQVYLSKLTDEDMQLIIRAAGEYQDRLHWSAIRNAIRDRRGYPVMIARKPEGDIKASDNNKPDLNSL